MLNFRGGIKPDGHKYTRNIPVAETLSPDYVRIFTYGDTPCVMTGDIVTIGQPITKKCKAHASICGVVYEIANSHIVIKNNGEHNIYCANLPFNKKLSAARYEDILAFAKNKGICFDGEFLADKLENAKDKVKVLIISCGETEPFSCARYKVLEGSKKEIIYGTKILMKALGVRKAAITIEATYFKDYLQLKELVGKAGNIEIITHTSKYPAEHPSILKKSFKKKYVADKNITEDQILMISCEEAAALFASFKSGLPMINRLVTVDGDTVNNPLTVKAPIGTSIEYLLKLCEEDSQYTDVILSGNPISTDKIERQDFIQKHNYSILALGEKFHVSESNECISCGLCHKVCPMNLYPVRINIENNKHEKCIGCGCCTYICPSKIDFSHLYNEEVEK